MTQPPDERDPNAPNEVPPADQPPGEAPTQAWAPPPSPDAAPPPPPAAAAIPPPATSPNVLAAQAAAPPPGPTVAWSPPAAAPEVGAPGLTWSDTPSRFVAYVIDLFLIGILAGIVAALLGAGQTISTSTGQVAGSQTSPLFYAINAAIGGVYFILSWSGGRRATLGQRLLKIQVGNAFDGKALTTTQAVKRWIGLGSFLGLFAIVPSTAVLGAVNLLEFIWTIVLLITTATSPTKQGLHDRFANSAVVRPSGAGAGVATACLILVIALLVISLLSIVALIFLGAQVSSILSEVGNSV